MILVLLGCAQPLDDTGRRAGPGGGGGGGEVPDDQTEEGGDLPFFDSDWQRGEPSGPQEEPTGQVCYLGADRVGTTCLDVVDRSAAWGSDWDWPEPLDGDPAYTAPSRFVDLDYADAELALAPNFVLEEFMQAWKGRYGVIQPHLVQSIQDLRELSGGAIYVNSGFRNPAYNESVGGATWSRHQYGDAVDMDSAVLSLTELGELCDALGADYVGYYSGHVHCDWRYSELEPAFFDLD